MILYFLQIDWTRGPPGSACIDDGRQPSRDFGRLFLQVFVNHIEEAPVLPMSLREEISKKDDSKNKSFSQDRPLSTDEGAGLNDRNPKWRVLIASRSFFFFF